MQSTAHFYPNQRTMNKKQKTMLIRIVVSAVLVLAFAFLPIKEIWGGYLRLALFLIPYFIIGYDILRKAIKSVINRQRFDECFLMAIATIGAIALGDYVEGVCVMLFYQIGELFQSVAVGKSRRSISELMDIRPDYANLEQEDGSFEQVDPDEVEIGSVIIVRPGEKIPIDGNVLSGTSTIDTMALTGESRPRTVREGDSVLSGCINQSGLLRIETTREFGESTASKILELVENSGMKKSRSENFITKFARVYTPAVVYSALALAVLPPVIRLLIGTTPAWSTWIMRALTFLVISCPCALVVSIPLSFFAGIGAASKNGILVKGSVYLEELSNTKIISFDKTGTITEGVFKVVKVCALNRSEEELLSLAARAEENSSHPIAQSIREAKKASALASSDTTKDTASDPALADLRTQPFSQNLISAIDSAVLSEVEEISGHGVSCLVGDTRVRIGNHKLMSKALNDEELSRIPDDIPEGITVVHLSADGVYEGYILISDVVKGTSKEAIAALKKAGIRKTVMLTGDSASVANETAKALAIDEVYAELLPQDKVAKVESLLLEKEKNDKLAFVGDGINDAPVLARSDIGIAMGALGSDAAIEAADIVLMDDDPLKIAKAIRISKKCLRIVYENIYFAIGVKLVCLLLGALGIANMWLAIFADVGVMVLAVLNAIRALRVH